MRQYLWMALGAALMAVTTAAISADFQLSRTGLSGTSTGDITMASGDQIFIDDGSASDPAIALASDTDTGWYGTAAGGWIFGRGGSETLRINSSDLRIATNKYLLFQETSTPAGTSCDATAEGGRVTSVSGGTIRGLYLCDQGGATTGWVVVHYTLDPTISSGFGTTPSISMNRGPRAFRVNVGTGGTASAGVIALPTAGNGWNCHVENLTATAANRANQRTVQTAGTTTTVTVQNQTISTGAALAWTASDVLALACFAT